MRMVKPRRLTIVGIAVGVLCVAGVMATLTDALPRAQSVQAAAGLPDTADSRQIQATIRRANLIEEDASRTFDTSQFATVYINDPRGGKLHEAYLSLVRDYLGKDGASAGWLDYKLAYYTFWKTGALRLEKLTAKAKNEGRDLTVEESRSLFDKAGRPAAGRGPEGLNIEVEFDSIAIYGDVAVARYHGTGTFWETTLVQVGGKWYIAGQTGRVNP